MNAVDPTPRSNVKFSLMVVLIIESVDLGPVVIVEPSDSFKLLISKDSPNSAPNNVRSAITSVFTSQTSDTYERC
jgi:hypothetical protein